ncbi:MAG TPA: signal peptidase I [Gaiellaceae bacterium]|jgi:signal peptidase I|nr:signal peptidase I [Gaiellaceae bacterium]
MNPLDRLTSRVSEPWRSVLDWTLSILVAVVIVLAVKVEVANPYRVPSASMEPTLHCARPAAGCQSGHSDRVVANRFIYRFRDPERGEIVVFDAPAKTRSVCNEGGTFVKRIIGLPGELVSERSGVVYIDGRKLDEPYVEPALRDERTGQWPRIPPGHYFMMGDNRSHSCDSRSWGTVPRENLIGPVVLTYWPLDRIGSP